MWDICNRQVADISRLSLSLNLVTVLQSEYCRQVAIFPSISGDFLLVDNSTWVRLSRRSFFDPESEWVGFGLWPLLELSNWFVAAVKSSELDVLSKAPPSISSSGSSCRRISSLRLSKASVWAFETSTSCVSELCKPCKTLAMLAELFSPQSWRVGTGICFFPVVSAHVPSVDDLFFQIAYLKWVSAKCKRNFSEFHSAKIFAAYRRREAISAGVRMCDAISWDPCGSGDEKELMSGRASIIVWLQYGLHDGKKYKAKKEQ